MTPHENILSLSSLTPVRKKIAPHERLPGDKIIQTQAGLLKTSPDQIWVDRLPAMAISKADFVEIELLYQAITESQSASRNRHNCAYTDHQVADMYLEQQAQYLTTLWIIATYLQKCFASHTRPRTLDSFTLTSSLSEQIFLQNAFDHSVLHPMERDALDHFLMSSVNSWIRVHIKSGDQDGLVRTNSDYSNPDHLYSEEDVFNHLWIDVERRWSQSSELKRWLAKLNRSQDFLIDSFGNDFSLLEGHSLNLRLQDPSWVGPLQFRTGFPFVATGGKDWDRPHRVIRYRVVSSPTEGTWTDLVDRFLLQVAGSDFVRAYKLGSGKNRHPNGHKAGMYFAIDDLIESARETELLLLRPEDHGLTLEPQTLDDHEEELALYSLQRLIAMLNADTPREELKVLRESRPDYPRFALPKASA